MKKTLKAVETKKCVGCGNCLTICPVTAITFIVINGFQYPIINSDECINCGKCEKVCPENDEEISMAKPLSFFAAYADKQTMHPESTSGGICTFATEFMIKSGGIVYSVRFTENWDVEYAKLNNIYDIKPHVGSKYMQAHFNNVQKQKNLKISGLRLGYRGRIIGTRVGMVGMGVGA